ncbi:unnamed protein product [Lathyrus sativus]|nr:unnamed protein product [Lathyrus sativus]
MANDGVSNDIKDQHEEQSVTKISVLERERDELVSENNEKKKQIKKLMVEIDEVRNKGEETRQKIVELQDEVERLQDAVKATEAITARAAELETHVARLQHDVVLNLNAGEELKKVKAERETRLRNLEKRMDVLETKKIEERNQYSGFLMK